MSQNTPHNPLTNEAAPKRSRRKEARPGELLEAALDLCPEDASVDDVRAEAARLYRDLLRDLGHGPE